MVDIYKEAHQTFVIHATINVQRVKRLVLNARLVLHLLLRERALRVVIVLQNTTMTRVWLIARTVIQLA